MNKILPHLTDEHMNLYEWSGALGADSRLTARRRTPAWRASYGVLALLTTLLILNGCERQGPAEQAGERVDESIEAMKESASDTYDDLTGEPGPAEKAGREMDEAREAAGDKLEQLGEDLKQPGDASTP